MTTLRYEARGRLLSAGGSAVVFEDERELARIELEGGGLLSGPTWTWIGAFGPEWTLRAVRSDREYELARIDGVLAGRLRRSWMSRAMELHASDGTHATLGSRPLLGRDQTIALADGRVATIVRETSPFAMTSREQWRLELPDPVDEPLRTLLLGLPLALDHRRRREESAAT